MSGCPAANGEGSLEVSRDHYLATTSPLPHHNRPQPILSTLSPAHPNAPLKLWLKPGSVPWPGDDEPSTARLSAWVCRGEPASTLENPPLNGPQARLRRVCGTVRAPPATKGWLPFPPSHRESSVHAPIACPLHCTDTNGHAPLPARLAGKLSIERRPFSEISDLGVGLWGRYLSEVPCADPVRCLKRQRSSR